MLYSLICLISAALAILGASSQNTPETGTSCNSCCQGPIGPQGNAGIPGLPGSHGTNGIPGVGVVGPKGEAGIAGSKGEPGARADPGPRGESGEKGDRGDSGVRGLPGKMGPVGPQGVGSLGPQGLPGAKGESGITGNKGEPGRIAITRRSAFTAIKTSAQTGNKGDVVTFDELITDIGSDFSTSTSKFTCRVQGVYVFTFNLNTESGNDMDAVLVKNGNAIVGVALDGNAGKDNEVSGSAVLQMVVGDQVWIEHYINNQVVDYHTNNAGYSNFSGYLLYED